MGFASPGARMDIMAAPPVDVPLPWGAGFDAATEAERLTSGSESLSYQLQDATAKSLQRAADLGIRNDDGSMPPMLGPDPAPTGQLNAALSWLDGRKDAFAAFKSDPNGPPDPFLKTGEEIRREGARRTQKALAEAARAPLSARLAASAVEQAKEPLNMLAMVAGAGLGETALVARLALEAGSVTTSQALIDAAALPAKENAGVAPSLGQEATSLAATGLGTVLIGGALHGIGRVARMAGVLDEYHAKVGSGDIVPDRQMENAAAAVQDHLDTVPAGVTPTAEGAHLKATTAAVDVLRAEGEQAQGFAQARLDEASAAFHDAELPAELVRAPISEAERLRDPSQPGSATAYIDTLAAAIKDEEVNAARSADIRTSRRETLYAQIRRDYGGITPESLIPFTGKGKIGEFGMLGIARKNGWGLDQIVSELVTNGHVPEGTDINDLFAMLSNGTETAAMQEMRGERLALHHDALTKLDNEYRALRNARDVLRGTHGDEPTLAAVEHYAADPEGYVRRLTARHVDTVVAAAEAAPPPVPVVEPASAQVSASPSLVTPEQSAAVTSAVEANPDLAASYTNHLGETVKGNAGELMAAAKEEQATLRNFINCLVAPEVAE